MKALLTKLNELQKTLLFILVIDIILCLLSLIGVAFGQVGWLIGTALGSVGALINAALLIKGSEFILKEQKAGLFVLLFFLRMLVLIIVFGFCVLMQFQLKIPAFTNSIWGSLIGFSPSAVLVILVQSKANEKKGA